METTSPVEMLLAINSTPQAPRNSEGDIIRLADGDLALVYSRFSGGGSDHSAAGLAMRTSKNDGKTWSADKMLLSNEGTCNVMSVSLVPSRDNGILLFYLRKDSAATSCALYMRRSYDDLQTLSPPVKVTTLPGYHVVNNDRVIRLQSGRLLVPSALHTDLETINTSQPLHSEKAAMVVYHSDDDGATWQKDKSKILPIGQRKLVLQEPGLVQLSDGRIMMYIRTGHVFQYACYSSDGGETWSKPKPTPLASPLSPATIERVPGTDMLVAVWNDHTGRWPFQKNNRTPLCLSISTDNGKSWSASRIIEPDPGGWYCYTSMTFLKQQLLLSYCAGNGRRNGLNRLKVTSVPLDWLTCRK